MKGRLINNIGLKVIALLFSIVLWFVVMNVEDPVDTETFKGISVRIRNDDIITSKGKTYSISGDQTVAVTVKAKKSILTNLKEHPEKITAYADMQNLESRTLIPVEVNISGYEGEYEEVYTNPRNLEVEIENYLSKRFPIVAETRGTVRDGYVLGPVTPDPAYITIQGGVSAINQISKVVAKADVSGMSNDGTVPAELILYDAGGGVIDQFQFETNIGEKGVSVNVEMLDTKNIKLDVIYQEKIAENYFVEEVTVEPSEVQIAGRPDVLKAIDKITIPAEALEVNEINERTEIGIDLTPYLPENTKLVDESQRNIAVTISVSEGGTRRIHVPVSSIIPRELGDGLKVSFDSEQIELVFTGTEENLEKLDVDKINVYIDLKDIKQAGTYQVVPIVEGYGDCQYQGEKINITIEKKK
ncbi:MAG: hypothetical protein KHZ72_04640 [Lachnospiraceae bacterium]|nr:hypothetical protein [Lachnospiraceae bacterium]